MTLSRRLIPFLAVAFCATGLIATHAASDQFQISDSHYTLVPIVRGSAQHNSPHLRDAFGNSTNWAGYAVETNLNTPTLGAFTAVSGSWAVPTVVGPSSTSRTAQYSAAWVGIDGFEDPQLQALFSGYSAQQQRQMLLATQTVEQIGTEQDWTGKTSSYYAWFEFYPNYSYEIVGFTVKPGDSITGSVNYLGSNKWQCKLTNTTRNLAVTVTATFTADRYCAEWITEAPSSSSGELPLADFGKISFSNCTSTFNGATLPISGASWEAINMVGSNGTTVKAATSALNSAGNGFSVSWASN